MDKKIICGRNSVRDALLHQVPIKVVYYVGPLPFAVAEGIKHQMLSKVEMDKLVSGANHQGVAAEMHEYNYFDAAAFLTTAPEVVLVLDHIQDPHNLGAIMRTANAAGVKHLILPRNRAAMVTPSVLKVASGGSVGLQIARVNSLYDTLLSFRKNGYWIYATSFDEDAVAVNKVTYNYPAVIIVGNEDIGVSSTLRAMADAKVFIPMKGSVQSLNVSVATGIILFTMLK